MSGTYKPRNAEETLDVLRWALAGETPIEVVGHGSKRAIGRPIQTEATLDMSGVAGVTLYEPEELVLSARAGTPVAEIEALVAARGQELAFEPIDYGPLLGAPAGRGTIGGLLATNLSGPRRIAKGAARDHVLGIEAVSGRAEAFKSGGRVVKNVTGYDLSRGLAGSWGTLAVLTAVTFKVLPRAETSETVLIAGLDETRAVAAMAAAMGSSGEVSGAAHLPADTVAAVGGALAAAGRPATVFRLEGIPVSIAYRAEILGRALQGFGRLERLPAAESVSLWQAIRDVRPLWPEAAPETAVWRVSVAPTAGAAVLARVRAGAPGAGGFLDWQGGLVWIAVPAAVPEAGAGLVRGAVRAEGGGHATLIRAGAPVRASVPVFEPQPPALAALSRRLKEQFDPKGILDPGRMA
ncbi:FAD-binding protein [Prosthecomicrobium sp. N25]|uniref:FAD-binding protein n=1 Tax=Prosthecomicrobium sp. N25 TaxID=3129254 RepID=UPI003077A979